MTQQYFAAGLPVLLGRVQAVSTTGAAAARSALCRPAAKATRGDVPRELTEAGTEELRKFGAE